MKYFSTIKLIAVIVILYIVTDSGAAQDLDSYKVNRLNFIYRNLEYPTVTFDDLKNAWVITDPVFVREVFNRFVVNKALRINGKVPSYDDIKEKAKYVHNGDVFVFLKKRYYDDEIDTLKFFKEPSLMFPEDSTDYFFDGVYDYVYIKRILGERLYKDIQSKFYAFTDLTKTQYDSKPAYNFDIYLHFTDPHLMFWSATTSNNNKYLVSFFGKWGSDYISIPGWYYPTYVGGLRLNYMQELSNNDPKYSYTVSLGAGIPVKKQPFQEFDSEGYGRRLFNSGPSIYLQADGNPLGLLWEPIHFINVFLECNLSFALIQPGDLGLGYISEFYTPRNSLALMFRAKELFTVFNQGYFNAGIGFATHDIYNYLYRPGDIKFIDLDPKAKSKFKNMIVIESGVSNRGGLLMFNSALQINYNLVENAGYIGLKTLIMLSNTVGFDFKLFTSYKFHSKQLPFYRNSNYFVFSPVIRINY